MTRRAFLQYFCVVVLLVAQQGALMHAIWHAYDSHRTRVHAQETAHQTHQSGSESPSNQAGLCAFDIAFGQVLGAAHGGSIALAHVPVTVERIHDLTAPRLHAEALSPKSRGPPAPS